MLYRLSGVIGGILANRYFQNAIGNPVDTRWNSFIASAILLGDVLGLAVVAPLSWYIGRRLTVIICCWIGLCGVVLQSATYG